MADHFELTRDSDGDGEDRSRDQGGWVDCDANRSAGCEVKIFKKKKSKNKIQKIQIKK